MNPTMLLPFALGASCVAADWSLYDHIDDVFAYDGQYLREFKYAEADLRGLRGGRLMRSAFAKPDGGLRPFADGMGVKGEGREGQVLLAGENVMDPTVAEFVVTGGTKLTFDYGLSDRAVQRGNHGSRLLVELLAGDQKQDHTITIKENAWASRTIPLPAARQVLVRLIAFRRNNASTNWTGLVLRGDGKVGTREQARALSPNRDKVGKMDFTLKPSPHRLTAREGYDILFYRGTPWLSYAVKGFPRGCHEYQVGVGVNTYYVEGMTFTRCWPEGAEGVVVPEDSSINVDLQLCQRYNLPFKCPMSLAHCSPFLPAWLVAKENLGLEGYKLRKGGATHASFIKPKTMHYHKKGLEGWIKPFAGQPKAFVFSQEDDASLWDDQSADAMASWRAWLRKRFDGDFSAFAEYVDGAKGVTSFDRVPHTERFNADERFGHPMRLAYLKMLWISESYGDYLAEMFRYVRKLAPGVPLTQRYVNWPHGPYVSRRVNADYSYTFGHLTTEGVPNSYGIGKKYWTGIYAHMGTLPLPRGGSIGKTYSRDIRRGAMDEREWRINAYTSIANGCCGFEYSTLTPSWGERWWPAALLDHDFKPTPTGVAGIKVMKEVLGYSKYMMHYEHFDDVAVFHDAGFNTAYFGGRWGQSKVGLYALIRETNFHAAVLDDWDMTAENLRGRKVLVLGGTVSIAPEIQDAIRICVREGGTLIALFCSDGQGFPGCNSYAYASRPRESATERSFELPRAVAHLGDVLGIHTGSGAAARAVIVSDDRGAISLAGFNALVDEKRSVAQQACVAEWRPTRAARVLARFDDNAPAVIENRFGKGRAITFAVDLGLIANNITLPKLYAWWSDLLTSAGCRRAIDMGNCFVEAGAWHDDDGNRFVILINHNDDQPQMATLPDGRRVMLGAGEAKPFVLR